MTQEEEEALNLLANNHNRMWYGYDPRNRVHFTELKFYGTYQECLNLYRTFGVGGIIPMPTGINKFNWRLGQHTAKPILEMLIPILLKGSTSAKRKAHIIESLL